MRKTEIQRFTSWLGKRSYAARVKRLGIERIRAIARENGKQSGGRPPSKKGYTSGYGDNQDLKCPQRIVRESMSPGSTTN